MTVKSKLLGVLEQQKGKVLSGEKLAEELNCTRAAIWKAVKSLREEGYIIEAGPNKGYMLVEDCHHLSQEAIQPFLFTPEVYMEVCQQVDSRTPGQEVLFTGRIRPLSQRDSGARRKSSGEPSSYSRSGSGSLQGSERSNRYRTGY